jgi:hypothetical protein
LGGQQNSFGSDSLLQRFEDHTGKALEVDFQEQEGLGEVEQVVVQEEAAEERAKYQRCLERGRYLPTGKQ